MKQSTKNHIAGELHKVKGKVKEAVGEVTSIPDLAAKGQAKSRARKTQRKAQQAAERSDGAAASRQIRLVASETLRPPANMVASIAQWPRDLGAWSKALLSSLLRMTRSFFSYLGNAIRGISISRLYKQRSLQAA
jgi:uncharacterized protein YjbJ (UPF0337 family)